MHVTVAVCTWNRCGLLRQTLEHITRAAVPSGVEREVVVVNNHCTDATDTVIDEFVERLPLRRVFEPRPGVAHARNAALSSAAGDWVVFVDDDALVDASWLVEFHAATRAFPEAAAVGGVIVPWFPEPPDADLFEAFHWLRVGFCGLDHDRIAGPLPSDLLIHGPNMAYRRAALRDLRFNPSLGGNRSSTGGGDEGDLLGRLRSEAGVVVWWPAMRVRHYVLPSRMTLEYCLRFAADKGRERVLTERVRPARLLFGAPPWLWRRLAQLYVSCVMSYAVPETLWFNPAPLAEPPRPSMSPRARTLVWRQELALARGMIREYRRRAGRTVQDEDQTNGNRVRTT